MERVDSSEMLDERFGLFGNRVPVWTQKFDFGISGLLGEGDSVVGTEIGVATEENLVLRSSSEPGVQVKKTMY